MMLLSLLESSVGVSRMLLTDLGLPLPRELPLFSGEKTEPIVSATVRRVPPLFFFFKLGLFGSERVLGLMFCMLLLDLRRLEEGRVAYPVLAVRLVLLDQTLL